MGPSVNKLPRVTTPVNCHPQSAIDMQYAQDVMDAIKRLSMSELHSLRVSGHSMNAFKFFAIINVAMNRFAALVDEK